MSQHVWQVRRITPANAMDALEYFKVGLASGANYEEVKTWVGYHMEWLRQKGRGSLVSLYAKHMASDLKTRLEFKARSGAIYFWAYCEKSGHRYRRGINAANYRLAADKALAGLADLVGLVEDAPPHHIFDKLQEENRFDLTLPG